MQNILIGFGLLALASAGGVGFYFLARALFKHLDVYKITNRARSETFQREASMRRFSMADMRGISEQKYTTFKNSHER